MATPIRLFRRVALGIFLASPCALAVKNEALCKLSFYALLATPDEAQALAVSTYTSLLDLPRESVARQRWMAAMLKAEDPFVVPEGEAQLDAARKPLAEFKRMLKKLGWETPELRARMLATLRQRIARVENAREETARVIKENPGIKKFPAENGYHPKITADSRYVLTLGTASNGNTIIHTRDSATGKLESTELENSVGGQPTATELNGDGTKLIVKVDYGVQVHDVVNGKVSPKGKRIPLTLLDPMSPNSYVRKLTPLHNPNWMVAEVKGLRTACRFALLDVAQETLTPLSKEWSYGEIFGIPGRNAVAVIPHTLAPGEPKLLVVATIGTGGATTLKELPLPTTLINPALYDARGDWIAIGDKISRRLQFYGPNGASEPLAMHQPQPNEFYGQALIHPNEKEYGVLSLNTAKDQYQLFWYDMATKERIGKMFVPSGICTLTPDGEALIIANNDEVRIIPINLGITGQRPK